MTTYRPTPAVRRSLEALDAMPAKTMNLRNLERAMGVKLSYRGTMLSRLLCASLIVRDEIDPTMFHLTFKGMRTLAEWPKGRAT